MLLWWCFISGEFLNGRSQEIIDVTPVQGGKLFIRFSRCPRSHLALKCISLKCMLAVWSTRYLTLIAAEADASPNWLPKQKHALAKIFTTVCSAFSAKGRWNQQKQKFLVVTLIHQTASLDLLLLLSLNSVRCIHHYYQLQRPLKEWKFGFSSV